MTYIIPLILSVVWVIALVNLCSRRDIDVHSKISWVVIVVVLHFIGAIIYFIWGPKSETKKVQKPEVPDDSEPFYPENMKSWNPITGYNQGESGEGLNPNTKEK